MFVYFDLYIDLAFSGPYFFLSFREFITIGINWNFSQLFKPTRDIKLG